MNRNIRQQHLARRRECPLHNMQRRQSDHRIAQASQTIDQHPLHPSRIELECQNLAILGLLSGSSRLFAPGVS
jgi:hypothetical protein